MSEHVLYSGADPSYGDDVYESYSEKHKSQGSAYRHPSGYRSSATNTSVAIAGVGMVGVLTFILTCGGAAGGGGIEDFGAASSEPPSRSSHSPSHAPAPQDAQADYERDFDAMVESALAGADDLLRENGRDPEDVYRRAGENIDSLRTPNPIFPDNFPEEDV